MTTWQFATAPWTSLPDTELRAARSRSVTWRLAGNSEASLTLEGTHPETAGINELISDLWVLRNGKALFRGRFGPSSDNLDGTSHDVTFSAADYRAILDRRFLAEGDTLSYTNVETTDILWGLVTTTQAKAGGNLHLTRGASETFGANIAVFAAGDGIATAMETLLAGSDLAQQLRVGVTPNWDVLPDSSSVGQVFQVYKYGRGTDRQRTLDYGGRVSAATRQVDPGTYGNVVRATGSDAATPSVNLEKPGVGTDPAGRWELQVSSTAAHTGALLGKIGSNVLSTASVVQPSWVVTLRPNEWGGPDDVWLGDQVTLVVKSGRLDVVESLRVQEVGLALDEEDTESVTLTLGSPNPALRRQARAIDRRLSALERR